jgi:hypothetical protein
MIQGAGTVRLGGQGEACSSDFRRLGTAGSPKKAVVCNDDKAIRILQLTQEVRGSAAGKRCLSPTLFCGRSSGWITLEADGLPIKARPSEPTVAIADNVGGFWGKGVAFRGASNRNRITRQCHTIGLLFVSPPGTVGTGAGIRRYLALQILTKVFAANSHTVEAGRIRMSHLGRSGFLASRDSTACMATLATVTPFS